MIIMKPRRGYLVLASYRWSLQTRLAPALSPIILFYYCMPWHSNQYWTPILTMQFFTKRALRLAGFSASLCFGPSLQAHLRSKLPIPWYSNWMPFVTMPFVTMSLTL